MSAIAAFSAQRLSATATLLALRVALAQRGGSPGPTASQEKHPPLDVQRCSSGNGCSQEQLAVVLDANWRQLLAPDGETNCYEAGKWHAMHCPDGANCASSCSLVDLGPADYQSIYGVTGTGDSVHLKYVNPEGSIGSRLYLMEDESSYKMFKLKNKEFAFDVDVSNLPCGLNGALYFVEMPRDGGKGEGYNTAGAKYGTGYCDAQCPKDLHFIGGMANVEGWDSDRQAGTSGSCCSEIDIWEANSVSAAFTGHPCSTVGPQQCSGEECGDSELGARYQGLCDKDGCDFNSWRMGSRGFFGPGMTVDTSRPITVVTQFVTNDGSDYGDLAQIRRFYVQDGQVIDNSMSEVPGVLGSSITDEFCAEQKQAFAATRSRENPEGPFNHFAAKGGMRALGEALDRGMVFVLSLWDDSAASMQWLDASAPQDMPASSAGVSRGPCSSDSGKPEAERAQYPDAHVTFSNIRYGDLGTTTLGVPAPSAGAAAGPGPPAAGQAQQGSGAQTAQTSGGQVTVAQSPQPVAPIAQPVADEGGPLAKLSGLLHHLIGQSSINKVAPYGQASSGSSSLPASLGAFATVAVSAAVVGGAALIVRFRACVFRRADRTLYEHMSDGTELEEE